MKTFKKTPTINLLTLIIVVMLGIKVSELLISKFQKRPELIAENNANVSLDLIRYSNN